MASFFLGTGEEVLVDDEDFDLVSQYKWTRLKRRGKALPYVIEQRRRRKGKVPVILLHKLLVKCPEGQQIDHKNGSGIDNRRSNLRCVIRRYNSLNSGGWGTKSAYKGVYYFGFRNRKKSKPWVAKVDKKGLGYYSSPELAALVYDAYVRQSPWAEFGRFNFPLIGERGLGGEIRVV